MRDILFRGKRLDNGKWYYGSYLYLKNAPTYYWNGAVKGPYDDVHFIISDDDVNYAVDPSTVGQYTGLLDMNGNPIFEGDILRMENINPQICEVQFVEGAFCLLFRGCPHPTDIHYIHHAGKQISEVVGNRFENPELIRATGTDEGNADQDVLMPAT